MPQVKYAKLLPGSGLDIVKNYHERWTEINNKINAICEEVGGVKSRYMSRGTLLEGFCISLKGVPAGWRRDKKTPTYMVPDKKNKLGKTYAKRLKEIVLLTQEDLAKELGFPPFFGPLFNGFCTAVAHMVTKDSVYVAYPASLTLNHPHEPVTHEEWEGADKG